MTQLNIKNFMLKAGEVVKLNGVPIQLAQDAYFETHEDNYKYLLSQFESETPNQAASPDNLATKSESFESMKDSK
tara:strand:- start:597 stop:821 length:225 start_codon:yes stop_codon:yes gene_type:complete